MPTIPCWLCEDIRCGRHGCVSSGTWLIPACVRVVAAISFVFAYRLAALVLASVFALHLALAGSDLCDWLEQRLGAACVLFCDLLIEAV